MRDATLDTLAKLKTQRAVLREVTPTRISEFVATGRTYGDAWRDAGSDDERRRLLLHALDHVEVLPATAKDRVVFHWRPTPDELGSDSRGPSGDPSKRRKPAVTPSA